MYPRGGNILTAVVASLWGRILHRQAAEAAPRRPRWHPRLGLLHPRGGRMYISSGGCHPPRPRQRLHLYSDGCIPVSLATFQCFRPQPLFLLPHASQGNSYDGMEPFDHRDSSREGIFSPFMRVWIWNVSAVPSHFQVQCKVL